MTTNSTNIDLTLSSTKIKELERIADLFNSDSSQKWFVDLNKEKLTLSIAGKKVSK